MSPTVFMTEQDYRALVADGFQRRARAAGFQQWRTEAAMTGGCTHPIRLSGHWAIQDTTTGTALASRSGHVTVPCGNRRESVCVACSDRYAADAFHLLRAGLTGDTKGIPASVADKPRLFLTLTAPSFGPVHNRRAPHGKAIPCRCGDYHHPDDPRIGQPLDPEAYDYTGHVLWQAHAGDLWHRFTTYLKRYLAHAAGLPQRLFADHARLSFAKVAEFQRRGVIHFHAVLRLDGPDGAGDPTPRWATSDVLTDAIRLAHTNTVLTSPEVDGQTWELAFGEQIDIRPIRPAEAGQVEDDQGVITDDRLASYVAKYATKGTGKSEAVDRRIRTQADIDRLKVTEHHRRIIQTAWDLAAPLPCPDCHPNGFHTPEGCGCEHAQYCATCNNGGEVSRTVLWHRLHPEQADKPDPLDALKPRHWAHMLAFRGHFLTKSQYYSVPFRQIRDDRRRFRHEEVLAELGVSDDSITVINDWSLVSVGHSTPEERELAAAIAERQREARKHRYEIERED
ncbi:replication initiation protein [Saccharopolyspora terrae]|uniref:Replication initiation protein n=1 Tax=Saccharopolyspora terrae TaxID=2530384 RepID=A0A4R4VW19_9PSEU|nr:replication initiator [Saccharopolyspora terrae]TDD06655.1 replication initiation protein [Saccharopolyspora terrae]